MTPDEIQALQKEPRGEIMKYQELIRTIEEKHIQDYCPCDEHGKDPQWKCLGCAEDGLDVVFPCDAIEFADSLAAALANEKFWARKRQEVLREYGYETVETIADDETEEIQTKQEKPEHVENNWINCDGVGDKCSWQILGRWSLCPSHLIRNVWGGNR